MERLARDEDRTVRLFLAETCDDAPAEMLLEVWRWWDGSFTHPDRPRSHFNSPRTGLLRYAGASCGWMRHLALDDPESTPANVARLARDPEAEVRRRAAEDPRLSLADAVRLLNDSAGPTSAGPRCAIRGCRPAPLQDCCTTATRHARRSPIRRFRSPVLHRILAAAAAAAVAARR
ncbi:hypothetical protein [Streptomyces lavendulocolor]|uniref:hypothetical protein n=1 Tax=Streptomyces lavendulocolor TaxID=67316 RepID=UPI003C2FC2CD